MVQTAAPDFKDRKKLKLLLRKDTAFRKGLIGHGKVFKRIMADKEIILKISPRLFFEVLLGRALKEEGKRFYELATHHGTARI